MFKFYGKFMTAREYAFVPYIDVYAENKPPHPTEMKNLHMHVRKSFTLSDFSEARLIVSADDYCKIKVNGEFVGSGPAPGYVFAYYRNEFDLTKHLKAGENLLELEVYYQGEINRVWNSGDSVFGFVLDLYVDGKLYLSSDESFEYALSEAYTTKRLTGYATQYLEDYDSRLEGKLKWQSCTAREDIHSYEDKPAVPVSWEYLTPLTVIPFDGGIFCDFGQEIVACPKITAVGKSGDTVRILCGEEKTAEAPFVRYKERCNCEYNEVWTLYGSECTVEQYDYKAFRYMALEFSQDVEIVSVGANVRHYPFRDAACVLETNSPNLAAVFELCKNTIKYASQEIFEDCPGREKGQYAGDLTISSATHAWCARDLRLMRKAIENHMQAAVIDEGLLAVAPGSLRQEIADYSLQFPLLALRYYKLSGDTDFLKKCYSTALGVKRYFEKFRREDWLLEFVNTKWNLVDWPANVRDEYDFPLTLPIGKGCHNVINGFYAGFLSGMVEIEEILSLPHDGEFERVCDSYNRAFYNKDLGLYVDREESTHSAITSNILPLFYGICPDGADGKIAEYLINRGMACGTYMSYFFLKGLARAGRYEDVYNFIVSEDYTSWMNMIHEGATTTFEAWGMEQKFNCSLCHPWSTSALPVLLEDLLEAEPDGSYSTDRLPYGVEVKLTMSELIK